MDSIQAKITQSMDTIKNVIMGQDEAIELLFTALLANGHVLLESVPGSGKTKLAKSFAQVVVGQYGRVQFTPDVLPGDVTGLQFYNPKTQEFELRVGPVMTNILLADEINRATPKTQSSLLEVMEENQTTIDGETFFLDPPFMVIATQNPIESNQGTFPLPEAQLDRFLLKINMDYPSLDIEKKILDKYRMDDPLNDITSPSLLKDEIFIMQEEVKKIRLGETVTEYLLNIVRQTRQHADIELGISTRGALALIRGRNYVRPEDVKEMAPYVFAHRLVLSMEASLQKNSGQVVADILEFIEVPVEIGERD
ncbi:MoxR-like ATPase [Salinibacillus kushneri]|uniref:MoxR-like ATPase n=1 Tax=Salinibacillus kushneri TaxID=237682 RepID=A0A1H9YCH9_9BACI|nr:MoxR family ATPase [Salinibacillus kushneri]SES66648.1 MoxR-like ATPase [Salinibacillus kushneri]